MDLISSVEREKKKMIFLSLFSGGENQLVLVIDKLLAAYNKDHHGSSKVSIGPSLNQAYRAQPKSLNTFYAFLSGNT